MAVPRPARRRVELQVAARAVRFGARRAVRHHVQRIEHERPTLSPAARATGALARRLRGLALPPEATGDVLQPPMRRPPPPPCAAEGVARPPISRLDALLFAPRCRVRRQMSFSRAAAHTRRGRDQVFRATAGVFGRSMSARPRRLWRPSSRQPATPGRPRCRSLRRGGTLRRPAGRGGRPARLGRPSSTTRRAWTLATTDGLPGLRVLDRPVTPTSWQRDRDAADDRARPGPPRRRDRRHGHGGRPRRTGPHGGLHVLASAAPSAATPDAARPRLALETLRGFDLFPMTEHVELVATFILAG